MDEDSQMAKKQTPPDPGGNAVIIPLDGNQVRRLEGLPPEPMVFGCAVSPSGRKVATAFFFGEAERALYVWDAETGKARVLPLPAPDPPANPGSQPTGYAGGSQYPSFRE